MDKHDSKIITELSSDHRRTSPRRPPEVNVVGPGSHAEVRKDLTMSHVRSNP